MHYLEDYLELLEPLRAIMREKLTLMRENDLKLQVEYTQLEEDSSTFLHNYCLYQKHSLFSPTKSKLNLTNDQFEQLNVQQEKQQEYEKLIQKHQQLIEITTIKMNLANESHDFVEKYLKKLENDLHKFKMELEADYSGLTEILEKRFANEGSNEYNDKINENNNFDLSLLDIEPLFNSYDDLTISNLLSDDYINLGYLSSQSRLLSNNLSPYNLNRKQNQRFHSSLRGRKRLHDNKRKGNILIEPHSFNPSDSDEYSTINDSNLNIIDDETNLLTNFPQTIDQRRYCFCNEMSYGDMIACDNRNCRREWFHYSCVGIITPPKGKWFCNDCAQKLQISTTKRA